MQYAVCIYNNTIYIIVKYCIYTIGMFPMKARDFCTMIHVRKLRDGTILILNRYYIVCCIVNICRVLRVFVCSVCIL